MLKFEIIINHLSYLKNITFVVFLLNSSSTWPSHWEVFPQNVWWIGCTGDSHLALAETVWKSEKWTKSEPIIIRSICWKKPKISIFQKWLGQIGTLANCCVLIHRNGQNFHQIVSEKSRVVGFNPGSSESLKRISESHGNPPRLFSNLVDTVETLEVCSRAKSWVKSFFSCDCPLQNLVNAHMNDVWTVPMSFQKGTMCLLRKRVVRLLIFKHWVRFMSHSLEQRNSEILAVWKWVLIAGWKPGGVLMLFWLCLTLFRLGPVRRSCPTARSLLLKKRVMFVNFWWLGRQANATVSPTSSAPSFVSALTKESIGSNGSTV